LAKFERTSKELNLKEEEEKYNKSLKIAENSIYKQIAEQFGSKINPMRYSPRGKPSIHISCRIYQSMYDNFETIKDNKETPFRNMSEIYRAVMYFGGLVFFHIYDNDYMDENGKKLVKFIEKSEKKKFAMYLNDDIIEEIQKIYDMIEKKAVSHKKGIEWVNELLDLISEEDKQYCKQYAEKVFSGAKPIHVFEKATQGRSRNEDKNDL